MLQISDALWAKLGIGNALVPPQSVTVPYTSLLYALGDPNAVRIVASAQASARIGQTETVTTGEKMKYLLPTPDDALEPRATEAPIGTTLTIRPLDWRQGKIVLDVKFVSSRAQQPQKVDPGFLFADRPAPHQHPNGRQWRAVSDARGACDRRRAHGLRSPHVHPGPCGSHCKVTWLGFPPGPLRLSLCGYQRGEDRQMRSKDLGKGLWR